MPNVWFLKPEKEARIQEGVASDSTILVTFPQMISICNPSQSFLRGVDSLGPAAGSGSDAVPSSDGGEVEPEPLAMPELAALVEADAGGAAAESRRLGGALMPSENMQFRSGGEKYLILPFPGEIISYRCFKGCLKYL